MKKIIILISVILCMTFVTECSNNEIIGNTDDEILQYLNEDFLDNIGNDNLTIIDTVYIESSKIVIFSSHTGQGYLVYEKNKKGNYIMTDNTAQGIEADKLGVTDYIVRYNQIDSLENSKLAYLVISNGDKVSTVEMSINDHIFNETMEIGKPSMVILNDVLDVLSDEESKDTISFDCRYFDVNNKELKVE